MAREKPLSRDRLHSILSRFEAGVTMTLVGGYDTGAYFRFDGKATSSFTPGQQVGGRIVRDRGFVSESMEMTRAERFGHGGLRYGIGIFEARYREREAKFGRWLTEFAEKRSAT